MSIDRSLPVGPYGHDSTAEEVTRGMDLSDRVVLVKGTVLAYGTTDAVFTPEKLREAFTTYGQVMTLDPDNDEASARQGRLFCQFGQFTSAEAACRQSLKIDPDNSLAHAYLGIALSYLGMLLLCLTMNRHRAALLRGDLRLPTTSVMRLLAMGCFGFAGWLCIGSQGAEIGTVVWLCLTMLAGVLLHMVEASLPIHLSRHLSGRDLSVNDVNDGIVLFDHVNRP